MGSDIFCGHKWVRFNAGTELKRVIMVDFLIIQNTLIINLTLVTVMAVVDISTASKSATVGIPVTLESTYPFRFRLM